MQHKSRRALAIVCIVVIAVNGCARPRPSAPSSASQTCSPQPLTVPLFLRGTMTTWSLRDDLAF